MRLVWHDHPDQAVANQCRYLEEIRLRDGDKHYWHLVKQLLLTDPWFTFRVALEWAWLDEDLVGTTFIRHVAENWGSDIAVLFPRGHGKTLPMSGMFVTQILNNPNCALLEISRTEDNAEKFGSTVAEHLMSNDYLQRCFSRKHNPDDGFLPSTVSQCSSWGKDGYNLPWRTPRFDPTLLCIPLKGAKAGKHPDLIYIDDPTEKENNDPRGWGEVVTAINGCKFLLSADGFFVWSGTRWHDSDPLGKAESGKLIGKQGPFRFVKRSCYIDDDPELGVTYSRKQRWNMDKPTGYTRETLELMRAPEVEGGLGELFDAQMRNDPSPQERSDIKVKDILTYEPADAPTLGPVMVMAIETTGGGLPIYNGFIEWLEMMGFSLPLQELTNPVRKGITKKDRIVAALQPIIQRGSLRAPSWMLGDGSEKEGLGYELRRLGKATHDDIADAVHNVPLHCVNGVYPAHPSEPADVYITVDLSWSEEKRADWTVIFATAVDHNKSFWLLDYDRFQISSPTGIYNRLLAFYKKYDAERKPRSNGKKFPGAWR